MNDMLFDQPVVLHPPPAPVLDATGQPVHDRYGNPVTEPSPDVDALGWWELAETAENTDHAATVTDDVWLYLPEDQRITAHHEVTLPGEGRYRVDGHPGRQPGGFVLGGYVRARLKRARG